MTHHKPIPGIKCDVTNCYYNDRDRRCTAGEIKVGPQYANTSADTICATFKPSATGSAHSSPTY